MNALDLKKRLCNPPAEAVAAVGDAEVLGLFRGAGEVCAELLDGASKNTYLAAVVDIEAKYMAARAQLAAEIKAAMMAAFDELAKGL